MRAREGFTLIELLVVISIIGLISSIAVASLNSARDKARMAAGRQFDAQTSRVAGDMALGIWDFDECSGLILRLQRIGKRNTGTVGYFNGHIDSVRVYGKGLSAYDIERIYALEKNGSELAFSSDKVQ